MLGDSPANHFVEINELVEIGSGAKKKRENVVLSKYACYLIAMNGDDTSKPEIATAQTYFAEQTQQQEYEQSLTTEQRRLFLRNRVKDGNKKLMNAAQDAGVQRFAVFQDAGIKGLYNGHGIEGLKKIKGIAAQDDFLDCIDREELAANEFRITQTESKLRREKIQGEAKAIVTHHTVGKKVRKTIEELDGTMPEKLPAVPSIKPLADKQAKHSKELETPEDKLV